MRIYKRGQTFWVDYLDGDGERVRKSLGTTRRAEAEDRADRLVQETASVKRILAAWLRYQSARCKPRSVHLYKIVKKRFGMMWGDLPPGDITVALVETTQERLLEAGLSPRTINHQIGIALGALQWAHERGDTNCPPPKWKRLKVSGNRARKYLTPAEIEKLLETVEERRWRRFQPVVLLALYAGLRQQEIAWLEWRDIDLDDGWIHVRAKKGWSPKSRASERSVPIAEDLRDYLSSRDREQRWVAPQSPGVQWGRRNLTVQSRKLFRAAGIDDPESRHTLHRLRGTFATSVLRSGGDLESLRECLGHSALSVTAEYLAATSESKRRAVSGLSFGQT